MTDRTFCRGSAGLGHLFNRLGQALAHDRLLDLARRWFAATLDGSLGPTDADPGLLVGASGTGLCLLSAAGVKPWWDRVVLYGGPRPGDAPARLDADGRRPGVRPPPVDRAC